MVEGGGSEEFALTRRLLRTDRALFDALLEKLTAALIAYFRMQIAAGVDAIQIFDSWAGLLDAGDCELVSLRWIRELIAALPPGFPVIVFAKGAAAPLAAQAATGARVLGLDWTVDLAAAYDALNAHLPRDPATAPVAVQGNLDPAVLETDPATVHAATGRLLASMRGRPGHILNLGHGIRPGATLECVAALVDSVTGWK
jgi:uroporphyrinogen decarboxylase